MQQVLTALLDLNVAAVDGDIGRVHDVLFEDASWTIRYLVVDTGKWLTGRKVLLSPVAVLDAAWGQRQLKVRLTREQVKNSPDVDTDKPVSRQHERAYFDYYGYPYYWAGPLRWGAAPFPPAQETQSADVRAAEPNLPNAEGERLPANPHLRSARTVTGYGIEAIDGAIGHVEDFVYDEQDWSIQALAVDTRNWLPGRHVAVPIDRVESVRWEDRTVKVGLTQDAVRQSAPLRSQQILTPVRDPDRNSRVAGRREERGASAVKFVLGLLGAVVLVSGVVLSTLYWLTFRPS
jgi:uncharacterized protein YrrD